MQYVDKDGNIHDLPLASVQPILSPDPDNLLYESANGLKVPAGSAELNVEGRRIVVPINVEVEPGKVTRITLTKSAVRGLLNLGRDESILGGDHIFNFIKVMVSNAYCVVTGWTYLITPEEVVITVVCVGNETQTLYSVALQYFIVKSNA